MSVSNTVAWVNQRGFDSSTFRHFRISVMKRRNKNPLKYSLQHTQERARERYGFELSVDSYRNLCNNIRESFTGGIWVEAGRGMKIRCDGAPNYKMVNREGEQYTLVVPFEGHTLIAVFDVRRALVTTLLPPSDFADYLPD